MVKVPIIGSGQVQLEMTYQAGPLAQPITTQMQSPGHVKMLAIGGVTKLEHVAGLIAGNVQEDGYDIQSRAEYAVELAVEVLKQCHLMQTQIQGGDGGKEPEAS